MQFVSKEFVGGEDESILGNEEKAGYQHILFFPQCYYSIFVSVIKHGIYSVQEIGETLIHCSSYKENNKDVESFVNMFIVGALWDR